MNFLNPYMVWIKVGAAVAVLLLAYGFGYRTASLAGKFALASQLNAQAESYRQTVEHWQQQAYAADEKLQAALKAQPKTGQSVREGVRSAPSSCTIDAGVVDRLRAGARAANTTTSAG